MKIVVCDDKDQVIAEFKGSIVPHSGDIIVYTLLQEKIMVGHVSLTERRKVEEVIIDYPRGEVEIRVKS